MSFPLGRPILAMAAISMVCGLAILARPRPPRADLRVWVFADSHARAYREPVVGQPGLADQFRRQTGHSVAVDLISARALDVRLISLFNSGSRDVPDLVEIEIGSVGKYFRPPPDQVGLLPLTDLLKRDGLLNRFVAARFAPWSKQGIIFGIPQDLHPCTITYRKDLFDAAGIDLASAQTWQQFQELCLKYQAYWWPKDRNSGRRIARWSIELPATASDYLVVLLLQRGINIIDDRHRVHLDHPLVLDTIARYTRMVAGKKRIAADATPGGELWAMDLARGDLGALITPDWRAGLLPARAPHLAGRLAMMPLPRFDPGDSPTSTWGGTMMGIPRNCTDPQASWELLKFLCLSPQSARARAVTTHILPPIRDHWADSMYHQPDPYFGGQMIDELYIRLGDQLPARCVTPFSIAGSVALNMVLADARTYVEAHAGDAEDLLDRGLRTHLQRQLASAARQLRARIEFGTVE